MKEVKAFYYEGVNDVYEWITDTIETWRKESRVEFPQGSYIITVEYILEANAEKRIASVTQSELI